MRQQNCVHHGVYWCGGFGDKEMQTIKEGNEDVGVGKTGEKVKDRKRREK